MSEKQQSENLAQASTPAVSHIPATPLPDELVEAWRAIWNNAYHVDIDAYREPRAQLNVIADRALAYPKLIELARKYAEALAVPLHKAVLDGSDARNLLRELGELDVVVGTPQDLSPPNSPPAVTRRSE